MTIKAYLDEHRKLNLQNRDPSGPKWIDIIQETTSIWSNNACKGYVLKALKRYLQSYVEPATDDDFIQRILYALSVVFDDVSVEEAEKFFEESRFW